MIIKQISIVIGNKTGRLAEVTEIIAKSNINMRALTLAETSDSGVLRIIVNEPDKVEKILRENALTLSVTNVLSVCIDDVPGSLAKILRVLADNNINIKYLYVFVSKEDGDKAYAIIRVKREDVNKSAEILEKFGYSGLNIK